MVYILISILMLTAVFLLTVYSVLTGYARSGRNPPLPPGTSRKLTAGRRFQCCRYLQKFGHSIRSTRRSRTRAAQSLDNPSHRRQSCNCNQGSLLHRPVADVLEQETLLSGSLAAPVFELRAKSSAGRARKALGTKMLEH